MRPVFVYAPRVGPYWVDGAGPREGLNIPVVAWKNDCAHIVGAAMYAVNAAYPRHHWRDRARDVAGAVARWYGGLAWDVRGTVHLALLPGAARWGAVILELAGLDPDHDLLRVLAGEHHAAIQAAWCSLRRIADVLPAADWVAYAATLLPTPDAAPCWTAQAQEYKERWVITLTRDDGDLRATRVDVAAPLDWGVPRVWGAGLTLDEDAVVAQVVAAFY
jgi:hypothetical protein